MIPTQHVDFPFVKIDFQREKLHPFKLNNNKKTSTVGTTFSLPKQPKKITKICGSTEVRIFDLESPSTESIRRDWIRVGSKKVARGPWLKLYLGNEKINGRYEIKMKKLEPHACFASRSGVPIIGLFQKSFPYYSLSTVHI